MSGLFFFTLFGVIAMSVGATAFRLEKAAEENEVALALRGYSFFGIPIPDFIANLPFIGNLVTGGSNVITNFTGSVFSPAMDVVSLVTSGYLSKTSPIFKFVDNAVGGAFSALSGNGGIRPPLLDTGALFSILSNAVNSAGNTGNSFLQPILSLLNIPGSAFGSIIKSFAAVLGSIPTLQLVPGGQQAGSSGQNPPPQTQPGQTGAQGQPGQTGIQGQTGAQVQAGGQNQQPPPNNQQPGQGGSGR